MKSLSRHISLLPLVLLFGCVSVSKSVFKHGLPPVPFQDVVVYFPEDDIPEHTRVAILSGEGDDTYTSRSQLLDALRKEAGLLGANGVIVYPNEEASGGEKVADALLGWGNSNRQREAIAILIEIE